MHIHILGICGTFMGGVAALAREAGHRVTGCDANVYPPMSDQLRALGIDLIEGFAPEQLALKPDLFVVGNVVSRGNPLMEAVLDAGLPYFGICFGNQLFGRALGLGTYKLKFGHRGINQPVLDRTTGKVEVTAHNHGFAVDAPLDRATDTPYGEVTVSHVCLNDDVVEGLELRRDGRLVGFSVQYHPEAAAGPHDANYLFDRFVDVVSAGKDA